MRDAVRLVASPRVLYKEVDGEAVLLDLDSETYYGLNPAGARFWQLVTTAPSVGDAVEVLLEEYDVPSEVLRRDVEDLLDELLRHGLVQAPRA